MLKKSVQLKREQVRPKPKPVKAAKPARAASVDGRGKVHNESLAAGRKASYALEESAGKPSRKSTRGSANRMKADSQLVRRAMRAVRSPENRARVGK
ncbi:MAG TPA: hypothetical protein VI072_19880 [Polyangiaceae bacterium]